MGKAVVETAADMTLNAALSQYDNMVKDLYGLFTTSQSISEIYDNLEEYYKKAIMEQGIGKDEAAYYAQQIMSSFFDSSDSGSNNLLNIKSNDFQLSPVENTGLVNPAVMKSQIVEFMKYRAPIKGGLSLIEGIKTFGQVQKQMEVVESKNEYYKAKETLVGDFSDVWKEVREYQFRDENNYDDYSGHVGFPSEDYIKYEINELINSKDKLGNMYSTVMYYYQGNDYLSDVLADGYDLNEAYKLADDNTSIKIAGVPYNINNDYSEVQVNGYHPVGSHNDAANQTEWHSGSTEIIVYKYNTETKSYDRYDNCGTLGITSTASSNAGDIAQGLINTYNDLKTKIENSESYKILKDTSDYNMCVLRKFVYDVKNNGDDSYPKLIKEMAYVQRKMQNMYGYVSDTNNPGYNAFKKSMDDNGTWSQIESLKGDPSGYLNRYRDYVKKLSDSLNASDGLRVQYRNNIEGENGVKKQLFKIVSRFQNLRALIDKKRANLVNVKSKLNAALADAGTCDTKRNDWSTKTDGLGSDDQTAAANKTEITREETTMSTEEIQSMITRVDNAIGTLDKIKDKLNEFKIFCNQAGQYGISWEDFGSTEDAAIQTFYYQLISAVTNYGIVSDKALSDMYNAAKSKSDYDIIQGYLLSGNTGAIHVSESYVPADNEHALDLTKAQRKLYTWMYGNFGGKELPATVGGQTETDKVVISSKEATEDKEDNIGIKTIKEKTNNIKDSSVEKSADNTSNFDKDNAELPTKVLEEMNKKLNENDSDSPVELSEKGDESKKSEEKMMAAATGSDGGDGIAGLFKDVLEAISSKSQELLAKLRDEIYISTYIMNTFTYQTYEAELIDKYNNKNGTEIAVAAMYDKADDKYTLKSDYEKIAESAKSLTNISICPDNNYLYGSEIEYMIYGDPNKDAFTTIYIIRFACNTVYAFMDPEINQYTLSWATAIFGTPPLTPLVPVAKIAFTIAWSLAESGVDIYLLKQGQAVPLMKNSSTWVLLPSNIADLVSGEIGDQVKARVKEAAYSAITAGANKLNEWTNMADEELTKLIEDYKNGSEEAVKNMGEYITALEQSYTDQIVSYANQAVNEYISICNSVRDRLAAIEATVYTAEELANLSDDEKKFNELFYNRSYGDAQIAEFIKFELGEWLKEEKRNGTQNAIYEAKEIAVNTLIADVTTIIDDYNTLIGKTIIEGATDIKNSIDTKCSTIVDNVKTKINSAIDDASVYIKNGKDEIVKKFTNAIDGGAEKLKEYASNGIDKAFDSLSNVFADGNISDGAGKNPAQNLYATLLSWRYSDYLNVFLLVNLFVNDSKVLARMADVMQTNIVNMPNGNADFRFSKTYTYMSLTTEAEVKPLLSIGLLSNMGIDNTASEWYKINYNNILGY